MISVQGSVDACQPLRRVETEKRHVRAVSKVIAHMKANISEELDLDKLAFVGSVSKFHLIRIFESVTGITPHHFLSCLRIQRSKELLRRTSLSVTEICMEVGYSSLGSFSTIFAELVGFTPREFRALPKDLDLVDVRTAVDHYRLLDSKQRPHCIQGTIRASPKISGPIFVGLFPSGVPHCVPAEGALMFAAGEFRLFAPSLREWHILAVSVSVDELLHNVDEGPTGNRLVARTKCVAGPVSRVATPTLTLREQLDTDPPIVVALRALLAYQSSAVKADTAMM